MLWTLLIAAVIYQALGLIIALIIEQCGKDNEDFNMCWAYGIIVLPVLLVATIIKAAKKSHRNRKGICIVQKIDEKGKTIPSEEYLIRYEDIQDFENSKYYTVVNARPTPERLKSGYIYTENGESMVRCYDLEFLPENELSRVKNEINCFHCKYYSDYKVCSDNDLRCSTDAIDHILYDKFERKM